MHENFTSLQLALADGKQIAVVFTERIEEYDTYPEMNMRAHLKSVRRAAKDDVVVLEFDFTNFEYYNAQLERANYYDKNGVACLTARQANMYTGRETIYFDASIDPTEYFSEDIL